MLEGLFLVRESGIAWEGQVARELLKGNARRWKFFRHVEAIFFDKEEVFILPVDLLELRFGHPDDEGEEGFFSYHQKILR